MTTTLEEQQQEAEIGVTPNPIGGITTVEKRAVACYIALKEAIGERGVKFGEAMIDLRKQVDDSNSKDWMGTLKRLEISYETARYWIAVVKKKPTDRHKKEKVKEPSSWQASVGRVKAAVDELRMMVRSNEAGDYESLLRYAEELAEIVGRKLVTRGDNA